MNLTIVTVVLNNEQGLKETNSSILSQCTQNFEWVIIDGGSVDGTECLLKRLSRPNKLISESDKGIYDAMLKGLRHATGDYVLFLNAGDKFANHDGVLEILKNINELTVDVYFYSTLLLGKKKKYLRRSRTIESTLYSVPAVQQSTVYKIDKLSKIEWPVDYMICGDYAIAAQLYANKSTYFKSNYVLSVFSLGGVSTIKYKLLAREAKLVQTRYLNLHPALQLIFYLRRYLTGLITARIYS